MKKRLMAGLLISALCMSLTACSGNSTAESDTSGSDKAEDQKSYSISVILKTTASEYWGYVKAGVDAYAKDHPEHNISAKGPSSETAYDEQQNMIETDLNSGAYDAFVISPLQPDLVKTLISGQTAPIIALDSKIEAPEVRSFVGTGNESAAAQGGAQAVEAAKAAGWTDIKAIAISGVQGDSTCIDRMNGFQKGVESAGGTFLADEIQYGDAVADKAANCMEAIIQNHPEGVAIIIGANDDMAMAAARAAEGHEAYANTIFIGFDGTQSGCNAILSGQLTLSVAQQAYDMGYMAVEAAVDTLNGKELDSFIDSGCEVVDKSNAQARVDQLKGYLE